ncbi:MAG TPA: hypothetical protein VEL47_00935, partial [Myxococcota bacterium]|nr:hypothetical protein [Myxococcota bacterium]
TELYKPEQWHDFFLTVGGGAAALTGLLVVAMSLHLEAIINDAPLRHRALSIFVGLSATFIRCALALMGGQNQQAIGFELLIVCCFAFGIGFQSFLRTLKSKKKRLPRDVIYRSIGNISCYLGEMLGAVILISGFFWGLYLAAVTMVLNFYFMISGSWLLLARISWDEEANK